VITQIKGRLHRFRRMLVTSIFLPLFLTSFMLVPAIQAGNHSVASWYGGGEKLNRHTANGEVFNPTALTCASWNYAFNTRLKVINIVSGKSVIVRVNDRGPNKRLGRAIDLTRVAFSRIANPRKGLVFVEIERIRR